jgi:hypothetical protein
MRIAETLTMPLEKVLNLSVLEINLWYAWFKLQHDKGKESMSRGNANIRNPRTR